MICFRVQNAWMAHIALFHSVYGMRPAVSAAADQFRAAGHRVVTPDLYAGQSAPTVAEGFTLSDKIGWATMMQRARDAVRYLPDDAVLSGFSMGAGIAGALLAERPAAAGLLLLHGAAGDPGSIRVGLPVQMHIADPDEYDSPEDVATWHEAMAEAGADVEVFAYPGPGHLFTDPELPDYDEKAAALTWERSLAFLARLSS